MSEPWTRKEVIGERLVTFEGDEQTVVIYSFAGQDGVTRYVGSTSQKLRIRVRAHFTEVRNGSALPVHEWLREQAAFTVRVLERATPVTRETRERYWISQFGDLLNLTDGGPGMSGHRFAGTDHARRIAQKIRTAPRLACAQCGAEFHRKVSQARKFTRHFCSRACYAASLKGVSRPAPTVFTKRGVVAAAKARRARTHCRRGHQLSGDNLHTNARGARVCKACRKIHKATHLEKRRG